MKDDSPGPQTGPSETLPVLRRTLSETYRGGQMKRSRPGSSWLRRTIVENRNITGKMSSFFPRLRLRQHRASLPQ